MCGEQKDRRMGKDYEMFTDKELVQLAGQGDDCAEEHLIRKYKEIVRSRARIYFIVGADDEDVIHLLHWMIRIPEELVQDVCFLLPNTAVPKAYSDRKSVV